MTIDEAIQKHGAMAVFEAGAIGECENYAPLKALGMDVETIAEAESISHAAHDRLTVEEKAANYWEACQDMHKDRKPVDWHGMDDVSVGLVCLMRLRPLTFKDRCLVNCYRSS